MTALGSVEEQTLAKWQWQQGVSVNANLELEKLFPYLPNDKSDYG